MSECTHNDAMQRLLNGDYQDTDILQVTMLDMLDIIDALRAEVNKRNQPRSFLADIRRANGSGNGKSSQTRAQAKA
ncbi:MAG: hypothetical protein WCF85_21145 [Rhodospirillaceae bacterium]